MSPTPEPFPQGASSLPRRATADPDRFLIPTGHLPEGFVERVQSPELAPVAPRPAATVVLLRDAVGGAEALLLRRPRRSSFAADAWVFPGGAVDPADAELDLSRCSTGPSARWWAERLGVPDAREATAFVAAALREAWEETGILLSHEADASDARLRDARLELLHGRETLRTVVARLGVRLAADDLLYIAHWITPEPELRRYDTRFFLARVAEGAACDLHGEELVEARWIRPVDAVSAFETGTLRLLPPTAHTLRRLSGFQSLTELWDTLREAPVPTFLPRMRAHPEGVIIEI